MTDISLPQDPALATAVLEIESHIAEAGWDQPAQLYALVDTARIVEQEPELRRRRWGWTPPRQTDPSPRWSRTRLPDQTLEVMLESIVWPPEVTGCAAVVERLVLPPDVDGDIPDDPVAAEEFAREHPLRQEVRIVAGATRAGATYCALRLRAHDDDSSVVDGTELVPGLLDLLRSTLEVEA